MCTKAKDKIVMLFAILTFIVIIICLIGAYHAYGLQNETIFGGLSALFSGLAFAGLFCALMMQKEELALQRTQLADNNKALHDIAQAFKIVALLQSNKVAIENTEVHLKRIDELIEQLNQHPNNTNALEELTKLKKSCVALLRDARNKNMKDVIRENKLLEKSIG